MTTTLAIQPHPINLHPSPITVLWCMEEMVVHNTGVVFSLIHPFVMCNASLVSTQENV